MLSGFFWLQLILHRYVFVKENSCLLTVKGKIVYICSDIVYNFSCIVYIVPVKVKATQSQLTMIEDIVSKMIMKNIQCVNFLTLCKYVLTLHTILFTLCTYFLGMKIL